MWARRCTRFARVVVILCGTGRRNIEALRSELLPEECGAGRQFACLDWELGVELIVFSGNLIRDKTYHRSIVRQLAVL